MKVGLLVIGTMITVTTAFVRTAPPRQEPDGKTIYDENCKRCHGVIGTPPKTMKAKYPKIATFNAEFIAQHSEDSIVKVLTKGKNEDMKSFKDKMTPAEMAAVAKYVHQLASKPGS
jgi:mono/diheme cytochrome c family protein